MPPRRKKLSAVVKVQLPAGSATRIQLPSLSGVKKCVVNKEVVEKKEQPALIFAERPKDQSA